MISSITWLFVLSLCLGTQLTRCAAHQGEEEDAIVFLFFALLTGAIFTYLISRYLTEVPYTVAVFFAGVIIALAFNSSNPDVFDISLAEWEGVSGELILYIFLPALLFGECMTLNFHHVKESFWSATLLAGPGAVFGALLTAVFVKYALPYDWGWSLSLVFGSIMSATDPVAVVAILHSVGANIDLTYVIVGEALLNDGVALVLYTLFVELVMVNGPSTLHAEDVVVYFVKVITISPLIGLAFALGSIILIGLANMRSREEDTTIQLAICGNTLFSVMKIAYLL